MLGLGESDDELKEAMADLRAIDVDILTFGQYHQVSFEENIQQCLSIYGRSRVLAHFMLDVFWLGYANVAKLL